MEHTLPFKSNEKISKICKKKKSFSVATLFQFCSSLHLHLDSNSDPGGSDEVLVRVSKSDFKNILKSMSLDGGTVFLT